MKDEQLLRYSRQIMLPQMDVAGQQRLIDATVLIIGMGGLGCPAAMYLAAAGVGHLIIADDDLVELTNLQRQVAHSQSMLGEPKVVSAQQILLGLNPDLKITALQKRLEGSELGEAVGQADLIVDACDNFATRFAINSACIEAFDRHGYRLGYGGGFYDRTIENLRQTKSVSVFGVAYAAQEMNQVIKGPFDQPLDAVVTEQGVISFNP